MRQGKKEQGQRGDEEGNGDKNDSGFQDEDVFENVVGDEDFGKLVWNGLEEMRDIQ
jgi:hypothetical protein